MAYRTDGKSESRSTEVKVGRSQEDSELDGEVICLTIQSDSSSLLSGTSLFIISSISFKSNFEKVNVKKVAMHSSLASLATKGNDWSDDFQS